MIFQLNMNFKICTRIYNKKYEKMQTLQLKFMLAGSNKTHPTNVLERASTTLRRLALAQ